MERQSGPTRAFSVSLGPMTHRPFAQLVPWGFALFGLALSACGGKSKGAEAPRVQSAAPPSDPPAESVATPVTELSRADVVAVVDAGLGRFLQDLEVKAELKEGKFVGFRIVRINNVERFRGVGLEPGDVVTQVNGQSIEQEGEAYQTFQSLKTAPYLEIDYLRHGEKMRLSLPIIGEPPAPSGTGGAASASEKGPS